MHAPDCSTRSNSRSMCSILCLWRAGEPPQKEPAQHVVKVWMEDKLNRKRHPHPLNVQDEVSTAIRLCNATCPILSPLTRRVRWLNCERRLPRWIYLHNFCLLYVSFSVYELAHIVLYLHEGAVRYSSPLILCYIDKEIIFFLSLSYPILWSIILIYALL